MLFGFPGKSNPFVFRYRFRMYRRTQRKKTLRKNRKKRYIFGSRQNLQRSLFPQIVQRFRNDKTETEFLIGIQILLLFYGNLFTRERLHFFFVIAFVRFCPLGRSKSAATGQQKNQRCSNKNRSLGCIVFVFHHNLLYCKHKICRAAFCDASQKTGFAGFRLSASFLRNGFAAPPIPAAHNINGEFL